MERNDDVIDVTPVDQSQTQSSPASPSMHAQQPKASHGGKPYYTFNGTSWHNDAPQPPSGTANGPIPVDARVIDGRGASAASEAPKSRLGGAARMAAGGVVALVGIPMLILPGPGLLAIGGGAYLMASGAKRLFGK